MIEILILYVLNKREITLYGIRKEIIELFGTFTIPSIGTIHPALKRLLNEKAITVYEKVSDGGKKFCYYSITKKGLEVFKELFFNSVSDNPSLFSTQLQARFGTMGLLSPADRKIFLTEALKKVEIYETEINQKLNNEFLDFDEFQKMLLEKTLNDMKSIRDYIKALRAKYVG